MRYNRCSKAELVKFAADPGVHVNSSQPNNVPYKRDYVAALVDADKQATFQFNELLPVYEELLTLQDSFFCYPRILRTCRQINQETTGLLYNLNYIDFVIKGSAVFAHGRRCGSYVPALLLRMMRRTPDVHLTGLIWPEFLRRARHLRVLVPEDTWRRVAPDQRTDSIGNTLYSLCRMLREGNHIRRLRMVMQPSRGSTFESMQAMFYPFRLLGDLSLEIVDKSGTSLANFYTDRDANIDFPGFWVQMQLLYQCFSTTAALANSAVRFRAAPWTLANSAAALSFPALTTLDSAADVLQEAASVVLEWSSSEYGMVPHWLHAFHLVYHAAKNCDGERKPSTRTSTAALDVKSIPSTLPGNRLGEPSIGVKLLIRVRGLEFQA